MIAALDGQDFKIRAIRSRFMRLGDGATLKPLTEKSGFLGDLKAKTFQPIGEQPAPNYPTAWLPSERVAKAWQAMISERPFP